ncbi:MAG: 5-keto-L-gluconate epimerase [Anaerolineae bacterium]
MKLSLATPTPEVKTTVPVALLSGTFAERLQKAARLGYDGVELMVVRPHELSASETRAQLSRAGLEVAAIATGAIYMTDRVTLLASDPEVSRQAVSRLEALIDLAAALEAPLVTIGSFRGRLAWAGGPPAQGELIDILRSAAEKAKRQGVRLVLEPVNRYEGDIINTASEGLALIEEVGHRHLGLLLDTYHVNIEESSLTEPFRQAVAAGRLWHVHLGDSNRLPPGQGHLDFASIVAALREAGYQGYLSAELLARPDPDKAAEATIRYMRQYIPGS